MLNHVVAVVSAGIIALAGTDAATVASALRAPKGLNPVYKLGCNFYATATVNLEDKILSIYLNDPDPKNIAVGAKIAAIKASYYRETVKPDGTVEKDLTIPEGTTDDREKPWLGAKPDPVTGVGVADAMYYLDFLGRTDGKGDFKPFSVTIILTLDVVCNVSGKAENKAMIVEIPFNALTEESFVIGSITWR